MCQLKSLTFEAFIFLFPLHKSLAKQNRTISDCVTCSFKIRFVSYSLSLEFGASEFFLGPDIVAVIELTPTGQRLPVLWQVQRHVTKQKTTNNQTSRPSDYPTNRQTNKQATIKANEADQVQLDCN